MTSTAQPAAAVGGSDRPFASPHAPIAAYRPRLDPLATTALSLVTNTVTTSALGVLFWTVASRMYSPAELGEDAALISAMMLLSVVSQLNLSLGIPRLLPQVSRRRLAVAGAYGVTAAVGVVVTGAFVVVAPAVSDGFAFLEQEPMVAAVLVAAVVLWNVFALQDAVLASSPWAPVLPVENGVFGILKIVLIAWAAGTPTGHGIFLGWVIAMVAMVIPVNALIFSRVLAPSTLPVEPDESVLPIRRRSLVARYVAGDYGAALLSQGYSFFLPLLVVAVMGRTANGYFYVAFLIAGAVAAMGQALSTALVVHGSHDEKSVCELARRSMERCVKFLVPAVGLLFLMAPVLLRPFGDDFVDNGTAVLRLLLIGTVPQAAVTVYLGVERVRGRPQRLLVVEAATALLATAGAVAGMKLFGINGVGWAWIVAQSAVAAVVARPLMAVCRPA